MNIRCVNDDEVCQLRPTSANSGELRESLCLTTFLTSLVTSSVHGKCACVGGCNLFGYNENGRTFFKPSREELSTGHNVALFTIRDRRSEGGGR